MYLARLHLGGSRGANFEDFFPEPKPMGETTGGDIWLIFYPRIFSVIFKGSQVDGNFFGFVKTQHVWDASWANIKF